MNHLELVRKAIRKSASKTKIPTTLVGAEGLNFLFVEWVSDAWADIQREHRDTWFRASLDLTLNLVVGQETYSMPTGLESLNLRTLSVRHVGGNSIPLEFIRYEYWAKWLRDRTNVPSQTYFGYPCSITISPQNEIIIYPEPDDSYELRFDGELEIQVFEVDLSVDDTAIPINLNKDYHDMIVWRAVMYYAEHFEDSGKLVEAQERYRALMKRVGKNFMPLMFAEEGQLY